MSDVKEESGVSKTIENLEEQVKGLKQRVVDVEKQREWVIQDFAKSLVFHHLGTTQNDQRLIIRKEMEKELAK